MSEQGKKAMSTAHFEAVMEAAYNELPNEERKADLLAKVRRIHYKACIRKGFTAEQALFLCTQTNFD